MLTEEPKEKLKAILSKEALSISLPGDPKTKLRPRFARNKRRVRTFDPQSDDKETTRWQIKSRVGAMEPLKGPLGLSVICVFSTPKSKNKEDFHIVKPDLDNLIKWVGDVGNGILWYDDKQIIKINALKIYGEEPKTIITVSKVFDWNYNN